MELLLDSHSLLWAVFEPKKLSLEAKQAIALPENIVYVSIVSLWEIGIKQNIGRLSIPARFFDSLPLAGFEILELKVSHIKTYKQLPLHHRDPFDRMLVAQAMTEDLVLVTRDSKIQLYEVPILVA